MPLERTLADFAAALASSATPPFTRGRAGRPDARRFAVYRNNVAVGLIGALEARYPVTRRLVGDAFFRAMAGAFVAARKPASPVMIAYGADFPGFVAGFAPARELVYLADVARLENAWVEAYHAAEAAPLQISDLAALDATRLGDLTFAFHPAARLLRFDHPAASIWAAHQDADEPRAPEVWGEEAALIVRPHADVEVRRLPPGGFSFASALLSGATLARAAPEAEDVGAHLVGLVEAGALCGFH